MISDINFGNTVQIELIDLIFYTPVKLPFNRTQGYVGNFSKNVKTWNETSTF